MIHLRLYDTAGFISVCVHQGPETGALELKQTGLINCIIEALGLNCGKVDAKWTSAKGNLLVRDNNGLKVEEGFNYASVVGMFLYLSGHT